LRLFSMKKFAAIGLLLMLVLPYAGTRAWLTWQHKKVKKSVKWRMIDGLEREELMVLKFTVEETKTKLSWKHSREFSYLGEWYDIVNTTQRADSIEYLVWHDHEETQLANRLDFLVKSVWENNPGRQEKQGRLMLFMKTLFAEPTPDLVAVLHTDSISVAGFPPFPVDSRPGCGPDGPPPEIC